MAQGSMAKPFTPIFPINGSYGGSGGPVVAADYNSRIDAENTAHVTSRPLGSTVNANANTSSYTNGTSNNTYGNKSGRNLLASIG